MLAHYVVSGNVFAFGITPLNWAATSFSQLGMRLMKRNAKIVTLIAITIITFSSVCGVYAASTMHETTWYYGNGAPTERRSDGTFYFDLETNDVYQCRKSGGNSFEWVPIANGIGSEGVDGKDGADGVNGATWLFGATDPTSSQGASGDLYLNFVTWDVFAKGGSSWTLLGNIKGQDGVNGLNGLNGLNGKDGINGTNGIDGRDGVNGTNGLDGKDGLDFNSTVTVFLYNGTNGINGTNGVNGRDGVDGIDGRNGLDGINGLNGLNGTNGTNGLNGMDGINATNGLDGKDGLDFNATGTMLLYNGTNGLNGVNGTNGSDGINGINGTNGLNGANGKDGVDGLNGADGKTWTGDVGGIPVANSYGYETPWWFYATLAVGFIVSLLIILYAFVTGNKSV